MCSRRTPSYHGWILSLIRLWNRLHTDAQLVLHTRLAYINIHQQSIRRQLQILFMPRNAPIGFLFHRPYTTASLESTGLGTNRRMLSYCMYVASGWRVRFIMLGPYCQVIHRDASLPHRLFFNPGFFHGDDLKASTCGMTNATLALIATKVAFDLSRFWEWLAPDRCWKSGAGLFVRAQVQQVVAEESLAECSRAEEMLQAGKTCWWRCWPSREAVWYNYVLFWLCCCSRFTYLRGT